MTRVQQAHRRRERKKAATRSRLIETAIALFGKRGIDGVTVEEIAEHADVAKGTVYNYFRTKEDMVVAFMVDLEKQVQAETGRLLPMRGTLDAVLSRFVEIQLRLKRPYHRFVRVLLGQMFSRGDHFLPYLVEIDKVTASAIEKLFTGLRDHRRVRADVELPELVMAFETIQLGITALWAVEGPPFAQTEAVLRLQMKLFAEGIEERA